MKLHRWLLLGIALGIGAAVIARADLNTAVMGPPGPAGPQGPQGEEGHQGVAGEIHVGEVDSGDPGTDAKIWNSGTEWDAVINFEIPRGDIGPQGIQGIQGIQGMQGAKGDQGNPGSAGSAGATGSTGAPGTAATIAVGTVTTGAAGSSATVTNGGTSSAAVLNFSIPRGATGSTGPSSIMTYTAASPVRSLNTTFQPSATSAVFVTYTVEIGCTATISGGQAASVELRSDANATPNTVRGQVYNANSVSLAIALTAVNTQRATLSYLTPPGHNIRLVSAGTCSITLVNQAEVTLSAS